MRFFYCIMTLLHTSMMFAQKFELFGGANSNIFHDYNNNEGHFRSSYTSDLGFTAGVGLDSIKIDWLPLRFTLQFDRYSGTLDASDGGLGGGYTTHATIDKSTLSLGIFPLNFRFLNRIDVNLGCLVSRLIDETVSGTSSGWMMTQPNWSYNLKDKYSRYSSNYYFGFQGRLAYDFKVSKSIWISPQYLYYFGLSNEFVQFPEDTKSMRHYFCIGIKRKI